MIRIASWFLLAAFGASAFAIALGFGFGDGARIGSAVFPLILSAGLVIISLWGGVAALAGNNPAYDESSMDWRAFIAVVAGVLIFIAAIDRIGLVPATIATMIISYLGQKEGKYISFIIYAALFAIVAWLLFTKGLGLPVGAFG